jgi:hypothetical protein
MRRKERATPLLIKKSTHCRKRKRIPSKKRKEGPTTKKKPDSRSIPRVHFLRINGSNSLSELMRDSKRNQGDISRSKRTNKNAF